MSIISDAIVMKSSEAQTVKAKLTAPMDVDFAKCECCGLTEECTLSYIETIRQRYQGKWICGLCAEAIKDEIIRCEMLISAEEALNRHLNFCKKFSSSSPPLNPTVHLIAAMRQILRRSLESPKLLRSMSSSPVESSGEKQHTVIVRSESCIPALSLVDSFHAMGLDGGCE
ncbi:hypothetical protein CQW23_15013 [Capsicum baccatum]|uniref:DUF1677 domain-containing protein n=1 Tax=Capsicum baccatum TaxID=33114 RepID=A0A2G2WKT0_CAPBA|nr:putative U6 snRNA-associated Sm-like protein LSm1-like [Capsicum annuum]PHT45855.1 hypothetical protein CQW23_15013 [Capsicum baccatum]PHU15047.1 hypothetical protein BC332_16252 [Capsicum chinense]